MSQFFENQNFVIKRKGLSDNKFRICAPGGDLLFYVEENIKWTPPFTMTIHFYRDEQKTQVILYASDGKNDDYINYLDVIDVVSNTKIGGVGGDWINFLEDAWAILGAGDKLVCQLRETNKKRAILSALTDGFVSQKLDFVNGEQTLGELRPKKVLMGSHLMVDFSQDSTSQLDHRLGLMAAIVVAAHQAQTEMD
jgi:hypothetical protein